VPETLPRLHSLGAGSRGRTDRAGKRDPLRDYLTKRRFGKLRLVSVSWILGTGNAVDFLAQHFTLLGIEFQWWMPIVGGACALYVLWLWATGQFRNR
jgi:hypothetical protein